ncbi:glycosyl transferase family 90-domain-containing protein [Mycena alexandri]|uniref:Glycosyl transferase family 90-domain-containing protein n=1 Tax=Mycena alexandri TaxID=1745969 RepID=A0AAD6XEM2_9AGAR|nr:glycosyl transferase family 90-domain-containing protein [Mycena alexandri]
MSTSWLPASFKRPNITLSNGDSHPLLPSNGGIPLGEDEEDDQEIELEMRRFRDEPRPKWMGIRRTRPPCFVLAAILAVFSLLALLAFLSSPSNTGPTLDFWDISNAKVDALYARQSSSLEQAIARYSLRNNRPPPPMYEQWYGFARDHSCLIDEYDQISRDFEPFYQLAQDDPAYFKKMVLKATPQVQEDARGMKTGVFADHKFSWTDEGFTLYTDEWPRTFGRFADFMPNMSIVLNGRDEPRVVFNYRLPNMRPKALNVSDAEPFRRTPHPTASYFKDDMNCLIPDRPMGFAGLANDASAFMLYSSSTDFTTDLYPVMSMTKISPCFADILVPSEFYYTDSGWAPKYAYANNITWADKTPQLYWRGMTSGGHVFGQNYHAFPRFRLIDIGREHRNLMNVLLSGFHDGLCGENCDAERIKEEYGIAHESSPREEVYKYKYLFDVDGNSFSGRYLGLLRSGSLVFKSTVFAEYFNDWLRPFEHYIPILPDLSDLVEKLEWAVAHDAEAHAIQQAGQAFAERVLSDAQNDCYFSAVLLEWARLQGMAEGMPPAETPAPVPVGADAEKDGDGGAPSKALPVEVTPVVPEQEDNAND